MMKMSDSKKWMSQFTKDSKNLQASMARPTRKLTTDSPSLNYALSGGLGFGHSTVFWGPEGGGKSLTSMLAVAALHKSDPEAIAVLISTEMRAPDPRRLAQIGVDPERLLIRSVNSINDVFGWVTSMDSNFVNNDGSKSGPGLAYALDQGMPVKILIVDSIKAIVAPKEEALETLADSGKIMGDISRALNPALRSILGTIRKYEISTILIQQVNMNLGDDSKYVKYIMPSGMALRHFAETICFIQRPGAKDSKIYDETTQNIREMPSQVGHTVRVTVEKANLGVPFREAEFRINYERGLVDTGLEIAKLATGLGVVKHPLNDAGKEIMAQWQFGEQKWIGFGKFVDAMESNPDLQREVMTAVYGFGKESK
jgi:RecA/RadA recombinase